MGRDENDRNIFVDVADAPLYLDAVHAGHLNVQNHAIQSKGRKRLDSIYEIFAAGIGFRSHAQRAHQSFQGATPRFIVIHNGNKQLVAGHRSVQDSEPAGGFAKLPVNLSRSGNAWILDLGPTHRQHWTTAEVLEMHRPSMRQQSFTDSAVQRGTNGARIGMCPSSYLQIFSNRQRSGEVSEIPHFQQYEPRLRFLGTSTGGV